MENCLVTKFKSDVVNGNLPILGYSKVIVNGKNRSSNFAILSIDKTGAIVNVAIGAYLLGGKTFVNGKTKIESGDSMRFAPSEVYELMMPKYDYMPITASVSDTVNTVSDLACNLDDYDFFDFLNTQPGDSWLNTIRFQATYDGEKSQGSIEKHLSWVNPAVLRFFDVSNSDITLNLGTTSLYKMYSLEKVRLDANTKIIGSLMDFINKLALENTTQLKARNNMLIFYVKEMGSDFDFGPLYVRNTASVRMHFTGSSAITITLNNNNTDVLKTFNYDIDTQTLTEA